MNVNDKLCPPQPLYPALTRVKQPGSTDLDLVWTLSEKSTNLLPLPEIKPRIFQSLTY